MEKKVETGLVLLIIAIVLVGGRFIFVNSQSQEIEPTPRNKETDIATQEASCNPEDIRDSEKFEGLAVMHAMQKDLTDEMNLFLYFDHELSDNEIQKIEKRRITIYKDSWIPPVGAHPLGFYSAKTKITDICRLINLDLVKRVVSGEELHEPLEEKLI